MERTVIEQAVIEQLIERTVAAVLVEWRACREAHWAGQPRHAGGRPSEPGQRLISEPIVLRLTVRPAARPTV